MVKSRIVKEISSVGTDWVQASLENQPSKYLILRARAEVISGPATQVALRIVEQHSATATVIDRVLEYSLTTNPLDSGESEWFRSRDLARKNPSLGTTFIQVMTDVVGPSIIKVSMDIEVE